jgi:hypothetical protein
MYLAMMASCLWNSPVSFDGVYFVLLSFKIYNFCFKICKK